MHPKDDSCLFWLCSEEGLRWRGLPKSVNWLRSLLHVPCVCADIVAYGPNGGLRSIRQANLAQNVTQVGLYGGDTHGKGGGNVLVALPRGNQGQDLELPFREGRNRTWAPPCLACRRCWAAAR